MGGLPHATRHRVGGTITEVPRLFEDEHLAALYHEKEWGEPSTPDHPLHGAHESPTGTIVVEHAEGEPVLREREDGLAVLAEGSWTHGPEFKLTWENGASVTTLCADVTREYLDGTRQPDHEPATDSDLD